MSELMNVEALRKRLNLRSRAAVYAKVKRGEIPGVVKLSKRSLRFQPEVIERWIERRTLSSAYPEKLKESLGQPAEPAGGASCTL